MVAFVHQFLAGKYVVHHSNPCWQSVGALVHESIARRVITWILVEPPVPGCWKEIRCYPWGMIAMADQENHQFFRHPLLLSFEPAAGKQLRLNVVHTKSKYSKLKRKEQWDAREQEAILDALLARAKLSSKAFRLREFLN